MICYHANTTIPSSHKSPYMIRQAEFLCQTTARNKKTVEEVAEFHQRRIVDSEKSSMQQSAIINKMTSGCLCYGSAQPVKRIQRKFFSRTSRFKLRLFHFSFSISKHKRNVELIILLCSKKLQRYRETLVSVIYGWCFHSISYCTTGFRHYL